MFWATISKNDERDDDAINEIATIVKRDIVDNAKRENERAIIVSTNRDVIAYVASNVYANDIDEIVVNVFDDSIYEIVDIARRESIDNVAFATIDENDDDTYVAYVDFYEYARVEFFVDTYTTINASFAFDTKIDDETRRSTREIARLRFAIEREFANARERANVTTRKTRRAIVERYATNASNVSREFDANERERASRRRNESIERSRT